MRRIGLLLKKDLRILGRSPILVAALIVYPLVFAALVGAVVRYAGDRPTIAFVDLDRLPEELTVGGQTFNVPAVLDQVNENADLVPMEQDEADRKLANGEVNAEIIVPRGFASRLRGMVESPQLLLKTARGGVATRVEQQTQALVYELNQRLQEILDTHTDPWGIKVALVELKGVDLPESMQRAMARQAEAEREKRAKVIHAQGEFEASQRLSEAAAVISSQPVALQLRYLQTLTEIGMEKNTTIVFPLPIDILDYFAKARGKD